MDEGGYMLLWWVIITGVCLRIFIRSVQARVDIEINTSPPPEKPKQPVIEGGSMPGMCGSCSEIRPCSCGQYCPTCLSDVQWRDDGSVFCKGCGLGLQRA